MELPAGKLRISKAPVHRPIRSRHHSRSLKRRSLKGMNLEKPANRRTIEYRQTGSWTDPTDELRMIDVDVRLVFFLLLGHGRKIRLSMGKPKLCGLDNFTIQRLAGVDRDIRQRFRLKVEAYI